MNREVEAEYFLAFSKVGQGHRTESPEFVEAHISFLYRLLLENLKLEVGGKAQVRLSYLLLLYSQSLNLKGWLGTMTLIEEQQFQWIGVYPQLNLYLDFIKGFRDGRRIGAEIWLTFKRVARDEIWVLPNR